MKNGLESLLVKIIELQESLLEEVERLNYKLNELSKVSEKERREIVRKVLDIDNKVNRTLRAYGEELLALKKLIQEVSVAQERSTKTPKKGRKKKKG